MSKIKRAIFSVCPDAKQESILARVYPSWERFSEKYGIDIIVVRRSFTGAHPYWDRWLCFEHLDAAGYDQLLLLDNDIWINDWARNPFDFWSGDFIGAAHESKQGGWSPEFIKEYYPGFLIDLSQEELGFAVYNFGVTLIARKHAAWARELFEVWRTEQLPRLENSPDSKHHSFFVKEADGPYMSWQLQRHKRIEEIPVGFNCIFWHWYAEHIKLPRIFLLLQTKAAEKLRGRIPHLLWKLMFAYAGSLISKCTRKCDFLHMAASKSPLALLEARPK